MQNQQPTPEQIQERLNSLPQDMQAAITSSDLTTKLQDLGTKYGLRLDKTGLMIQEVGLIMLGFEKSNEFVQHLQRDLGVDRETAESIAIDVDSQVFESIRTSLRQVQRGEHGQIHHDEDHGSSPARDSLIKDIEKTAAPVENFTSSSDYSAGIFSSSKHTAVSGEAWKPSVPAPAPTPYEMHGPEPILNLDEDLDEEEAPQETLQERMEATKVRIANDPYREPIE